MSWQATKWAIKQKVGNQGRKLLLIVLAEFADEHGYCWPSQGRLAKDTEASLDTVQRQTKKLIADGFVQVERPPKRRGQWQTFRYRLKMNGQNAEPQDTVRPPRSDPPPTERYVEYENAAGLGRTEPAIKPQRQAASETKPGRTAMRPNPSIEKSIEPLGEPPQQPPRATTSRFAAERLQAWQWEQAEEVVQSRIAQRLGNQGWSILVELSENDLDRLTKLEMKRELDDETLQQILQAAFRSKD